ncbi:LEA type 2 family protein [Ferroglobus sp.]|uniref:LEA type 2 family protein n=1 Tax=Ferroglobus sp. TaxID=2614230 RepID=UPI0025C24415|nr:LEA type 2 family protein [Ferroglobus sp.]
MVKKMLPILLLLILTSGCLGLGKPEVLSYKSEWGEITESYSEIITKMDVKNPNPFSIPLKAIDLTLYINNIELGKGRSIGDATLKPNAITTITISTKIDNSKIPEWWVSHIKNGEVSELLLKGNLIFNLIITEFKFPFEERDEIRTDILRGFKVDEKMNFGPLAANVKINPRWGEVKSDYTQIMLDTVIDSDVSFRLKGIKYEVLMNGIKIGEGYYDKDVEIGRNTKFTLELRLDNDKLDDWWVSHLKNGERSEVEIIVTGVFDLAGKTFEVDLIREKTSFRTEILT